MTASPVRSEARAGQLQAADILVLIPAKGGSTRLPRKNIADLGGRPLIGWAIDSAFRSGVSPHVVVSTDDAEIAQCAQACGASVPFVRPEHLSRDPAGVVVVALHALDWFEQQGTRFATLIILLPTCPFRSAEDIRDALDLFRARNGRFLMSVSQYAHAPFAALELRDGGLVPYFPEFIGRKSQDMPKAYRANGALHILDVPAFQATRSYYSQPLIGYEMPWERSIDIDEELDLELAASLLRRGLGVTGSKTP